MAEKFGIYIHWPFCISKCPYCDFNSHVKKVPVSDSWCKNILEEITYFHRKTNEKRVTSIFFGGGTPSLIRPKVIEKILKEISKHWVFDKDIEITLEANPSSVEISKFREFRELGINRISLGVQSLNDNALKFLGRNHSANDGREAIKIANKIFSNYSFDLIYARPNQSIKSWENELHESLKLAASHLSLYQLTIEPGTAFYRKKVKVPDHDVAADFYEKTQEILESNRLPAYEISNHATPGSECQHNLTYWEGHDYIGLGPGAHGRFVFQGENVATHQIYNPNAWERSVNKIGHGIAKYQIMAPKTRGEELIILGLRTSKGLKISYFENQTNLSFYEFVNSTQLNHLVKNNFLDYSNGYLKTTFPGRMCLNLVLEKLLA